MGTFQAAVERTEARLADGDASPPPVVRGISIEGTADDAEGARVKAAWESALAGVPAVADIGWDLKPVEGMTGWWEALPDQEIPLGTTWEIIYKLLAQEGVAHAEPLLLISQRLQEKDATSPGLRAFEAWGRPYVGETKKAVDAASTDAVWHLTMLGLQEAWKVWKMRAGFAELEPGTGIRVGHPDTGYTDHPLLEGKLINGKITGPEPGPGNFGKSFLENEQGRPGRDNLQGIPLADAPGHGTNTASLIVGGKWPVAGAGNPIGAAPGAKIIPLRIATRVIHFDFKNVRDAINEARAREADVISMSLGGPFPDRSLREAIKKAINAGMIVVSASGNLVPTTVFPAAYPESLAIGGVNALGLGWEGSSGGSMVDLSAPSSQVRHATATIEEGKKPFDVLPGWGTSFATALVAGIASLWLSYFGESTVPGEARANVAAKVGGFDMVQYAFACHLSRESYLEDNRGKPWEDEVWDFGHYGAGIADAERLLNSELPTEDEVREYKNKITARPTTLLGRLGELFTGRPLSQTISAQAELEPLAKNLLASDDPTLLSELLLCVVSDFTLLSAFLRYASDSKSPTLGSGSPYLLFDLLLRRYDQLGDLSAALRSAVEARKQSEAKSLARLHKADPAKAPTTRPPSHRPIRVFAADPSLQTSLATTAINTVTLPILWEDGLHPGPVGEYIEVVDMDPASGCAYAPVDLNNAHLLSRDGLDPSEGNPQFHQQMVYAVAMNTIAHFERALSRPVFWSCISPWRDDLPEEKVRNTRENLRGKPENPENENDRYVRRLRIYPHALREANAYYSPAKRALLFGYFPAARDDSGDSLPGGLVFSCLSNDIVAHETTHAILDGMHTYFNEPTNEDVLAFHEAFADIVALFQRFTYVEFLRHQISASRGDLTTESLLGQLAREFGLAVGGRQSLRTYLGDMVEDKNGERIWRPKKPDPSALAKANEPHQRGAVLVAAIFRAFLIVYNFRTADLLRLYTNGTGVLPAGQIHPDLVNRLADEAARTAGDILDVCVRAMDYVPPVDITFGEYLRALITADYERDRGDQRYRTAFIEAFRAWGIYPNEVQTLSTESLRWRSQEDLVSTHPLDNLLQQNYLQVKLASLLKEAEQWKPGQLRDQIFRESRDLQALMHGAIKGAGKNYSDAIPGLVVSKSFQVANIRVLRRILPDGGYQSQMVFEVIQTYHDDSELESWGLPLRGGATVIVDLQKGAVDYIIYKRLYDRAPDEQGSQQQVNQGRRDQQLQFLASGGPPMGLTAGAESSESDMASLFDSTCACTKRKHKIAFAFRREPFALLHRGIAEYETPRDRDDAADQGKENENGG